MYRFVCMSCTIVYDTLRESGPRSQPMREASACVWTLFAVSHKSLCRATESGPGVGPRGCLTSRQIVWYTQLSHQGRCQLDFTLEHRNYRLYRSLVESIVPTFLYSKVKSTWKHREKGVFCLLLLLFFSLTLVWTLSCSIPHCHIRCVRVVGGGKRNYRCVHGGKTAFSETIACITKYIENNLKNT